MAGPTADSMAATTSAATARHLVGLRVESTAHPTTVTAQKKAEMLVGMMVGMMDFSMLKETQSKTRTSPI